MMTLRADRRYVILVRHASRDFGSGDDESEQSMSGWTSDLNGVSPDFDAQGLPRTLAIAHRLADELGPIKVSHVWHSPHTVADQTAEVYRRVIAGRTQPVESEQHAALEPLSGSGTGVAASLRRLAGSEKLDIGSALIVVGHQPMLSQLALVLTRERLPAGTLPLGGSEAACLELDEAGESATLLWLLTEKPGDLMVDLKEKIQSKYDVAKFFLGAFVVNTGFVLSGQISDVSNPLDLGLVLLGSVLTLVALALTAATLFSYDALLMPTEFWTGPSTEGHGERGQVRSRPWSVLRPPSQAQVVLFYEMVHVWTAFFVPALCCAFAAVAAFLVALVHNRLYPCNGNGSGPGLAAFFGIAAVAAAALILPLAFHYRRNRPTLGSDD